MTQQRIVCSAVKISCRERELLFACVRHFDPQSCELMDIVDDWDYRSISDGKVEQGFFDNKYQFLTRKEAWAVAFKAGQIIHDHDKCVGTLYSEHLY